MDKETLMAFTPTDEMIAAGNTVFMAKAYTQTIRPDIEAIYKKHLDILRPLDRWSGEVITDVKKAYAMPDEDFVIYHRDTQEELRNKGWKFEPGQCPLLVAEGLEREARKVLIDVMEPITKLSYERLSYSSHAIENLQKIEDLTLRLLAPFCKPTLFKPVQS